MFQTLRLLLMGRNDEAALSKRKSLRRRRSDPTISWRDISPIDDAGYAGYIVDDRAIWNRRP